MKFRVNSISKTFASLLIDLGMLIVIKYLVTPSIYSINGYGKIAFWTLRVGTVMQTTDLIAVYTNVIQYFPDYFFYE